MRYFFIEPSAAAAPVVSITGAEAHHIKNVLRLKPGDSLNLFDGTGYEYDAVISLISAKAVAVEIRKRVKAPPPSDVNAPSPDPTPNAWPAVPRDGTASSPRPLNNAGVSIHFK